MGRLNRRRPAGTELLSIGAVSAGEDGASKHRCRRSNGTAVHIPPLGEVRRGILTQGRLPMEQTIAAISVVGTAGVVLMVAAVVGGGFTLAGAEVPVISSVVRQVVVGLVGATLLALDLTYVNAQTDRPGTAPTTTVPQPSTTDTRSVSPTSIPATSIPRTSCPDARSQPVRSGTVTDVDPRGAIDLDCDLITGVETAPGADVSGRVDGVVLDTVSETGSLAWVDNVSPDDFGRCDFLPFRSYTKTIRGLDRPQPGSGICVRTSEGNTAIIILDRPSTPTAPGLSFHYRIRYRTP